MTKNRFISNTSWILAGQVVKMIISLFVSLLTARYLGPSNQGVITYVASYISFFTSLIGLGLNGVIIHEFVNHQEDEGKILGTAIVLRFASSVISFVAFIALIYCIDSNDNTIITVAFLQAIQLPFLCLDTINYWYQAKLLSKYPTIVQTIAYVITSAYKVYLLCAGNNVLWFAFAVTLDIIVMAILYLAIYLKHKTQKLGFSGIIAKRLLKSGLPFILANIMVVIYGQMDRIMIKQMLGSTTEVGLYSTAIAVCSIIGFIPSAILDSARPLIAEAKKADEEKYKLRFRQLVAGLMWVCFLYSAFITVFSKPLLNLMYGDAYIGANICLKIAVWYTAFSYIGSARSFWLICENKKRYVFYFSALGAALNLILNLILIPVMGINGAALATLVTQIMANFIIPLLFKDTRDYGRAIICGITLRNIELKSALNKIKFKIFK